jgi:hypothetical protein
MKKLLLILAFATGSALAIDLGKGMQAVKARLHDAEQKIKSLFPGMYQDLQKINEKKKIEDWQKIEKIGKEVNLGQYIEAVSQAENVYKACRKEACLEIKKLETNAKSGKEQKAYHSAVESCLLQECDEQRKELLKAEKDFDNVWVTFVTKLADLKVIDKNEAEMIGKDRKLIDKFVVTRKKYEACMVAECRSLYLKTSSDIKNQSRYEKYERCLRKETDSNLTSRKCGKFSKGERDNMTLLRAFLVYMGVASLGSVIVGAVLFGTAGALGALNAQ